MQLFKIVVNDDAYTNLPEPSWIGAEISDSFIETSLGKIYFNLDERELTPIESGTYFLKTSGKILQWLYEEIEVELFIPDVGPSSFSMEEYAAWVMRLKVKRDVDKICFKLKEKSGKTWIKRNQYSNERKDEMIWNLDNAKVALASDLPIGSVDYIDEEVRVCFEQIKANKKHQIHFVVAWGDLIKEIIGPRQILLSAKLE